MHMAAVQAVEVELAADAALPVAEAGPARPVAQGSAVVDVPTRAAPIPVVLGQPVVAAVVGTIRSPRCPRRRSAIVFAAVAVAAAVVVAVAAVAAIDSSAIESSPSPPGGSSDSPPPSPPFEVPDCPGLGPCFNESGDSTRVLFWLWVGFFALVALCCCAFIGLAYRGGEPGNAAISLFCGIPISLIIAIGLVIGWRVQMSEDSPIDEHYAAAKQSLAKQSCAAGTCTKPHCCEADGMHDDWCQENCCVGACDPVTCSDHAAGELSHCDFGRCFGCKEPTCTARCPEGQHYQPGWILRGGAGGCNKDLVERGEVYCGCYEYEHWNSCRACPEGTWMGDAHHRGPEGTCIPESHQYPLPASQIPS